MNDELRKGKNPINRNTATVSHTSDPSHRQSSMLQTSLLIVPDHSEVFFNLRRIYFVINFTTARY